MGVDDEREVAGELLKFLTLAKLHSNTSNHSSCFIPMAL